MYRISGYFRGFLISRILVKDLRFYISLIIEPVPAKFLKYKSLENFHLHVQSNLSYPGALGLGGARNSDLSVSQNTI